MEVEHTPKAEYVNKLVAQVTGGAPPDTIGVSVTGDFNVVQAKGMVRELDTLLGGTATTWATGRRSAAPGQKGQADRPALRLDDHRLLLQRGPLQDPRGEDAYEHWKAGTWTWDTYLELVQRFNRVGDGASAR